MAQAITSSSSQWGYSVPLEETDGNAGARLPPPRAKRQTPQTSQQHDRDPRTMKSQTRRPSDIGIQSDSEETRQRRKTVKAGNATATATRKRSRNALRSGAVSAASGRERSLDPPGNFDDSAWIHRDKLAQIEIQEMVDAGIPVRHSRRSLSAGPAAAARDSRSPSPSRGEEEDYVYEQSEEQYEYGEEYNNGYEEFERKRISTIDQAEEEEDQYYDGTSNGHYNTSNPREAVAQDSETIPPSSSNHHARPSTSRIPISTASAVPVPHNVVGRDSPLPRSRHGSQAASGNWEDLMYARRGRSTSVGSHVLLDDDTSPRPESSYKISSANNSPPKARTPGKAGPYGQRKVSTPTTARPGSSASKKPPTSSNNAASSPTTTTAHRSNSRSSRPPLEGDPPWVTDMYKPDPRLPPDQQMLPTHARRLAQENWERNAGKTPASVYDRELRPLNDRDPSPNLPRDDSANEENASSSPIDATKNADGGLMLDTTALTLDPTTSQQRREVSEKGSPTKSTTTAGGGGYKITPTIVSPPEILRAPYSSHAGGMSADPSSAAAVEARQGGGLDEKKGAFDGGDEGDGGKKKSGGCGCCVVM